MPDDRSRVLKTVEDYEQQWSRIRQGSLIWVVYIDVNGEKIGIAGRAFHNAYSVEHDGYIYEVCVAVDRDVFLHIIPFQYVRGMWTRD